jgi:hypothetical protein
MYTQIFNLGFNFVKDKNLYKINRMDSYQEIISRLKFIGKLKKGEKINTKQMYVQQEGLATRLSRTFWAQDNRINTVNFIHETIKFSFELLNNYNRSDTTSEKELAKHLVNDLRRVNKGLENLKQTYILDTKFCCDIDTLIEDIKAKLVIYNEKYTMSVILEEVEIDSD